jgi:acyl dehydratase
MEPRAWRARAHNQATASENKIHADEVARAYGFRGGLVPGVTVYAYLVHPALEAWGADWLARGRADVVLHRPLYDGKEFTVEVKSHGGDAYGGRVIDGEGVECATGRVVLPAAPADAPLPRGDAPAPALERRPEATRAALERLRAQGMGAVELSWDGTGEMDRYTADPSDMVDLVRPDRGGFANPSFTLGLANAALARNVRLGPWIHVQSDVVHHAPVPLGARLRIESSVADLFARGGHEFVDLDVHVYRVPETPALSARHRAIYRLRPPR